MADAVNRENDLTALQRRLGYQFADSALVERALTHRSADSANNERLEFLGDGILNFVVAAALFDRCPSAPEGDLSRLRATLVREGTLAEVAEQLELADVLIVGPGETGDGSRRRDSIRADTLEAILGAIYLDGGFDAARGVIHRVYGDRLIDLPSADSLKDAKTQLQEWLQARGRTRPSYELVEARGAEHARQFVAACHLVDTDAQTHGRGNGRRPAEQEAARRMLDQLKRATDS